MSNIWQSNTGWLICLLTAALLWPGVVSAEADESGVEPRIAEYSVVALLTTSRVALQELDEIAEASERRLRCSAAITALVGLYQLHGCEWALFSLRRVYAHPDCPDLHLGYSADGRVSLRLEPLQLRNPAFTDYTIYLCTLQSNSALDLLGAEAAPLVIMQRDGTEISAQLLDSSHELWPHLDRLAHTFAPPGALPSGGGIAYKQLFAAPRLSHESISTVSLVWGSYVIIVPYYENEVGL